MVLVGVLVLASLEAGGSGGSLEAGGSGGSLETLLALVSLTVLVLFWPLVAVFVALGVFSTGVGGSEELNPSSKTLTRLVRRERTSESKRSMTLEILTSSSSSRFSRVVSGALAGVAVVSGVVVGVGGVASPEKTCWRALTTTSVRLVLVEATISSIAAKSSSGSLKVTGLVGIFYNVIQGDPIL